MDNNNKMMTFVHAQFGKLRSIMIDGEPWLVGKDVASALGYKNASKAVLTHVDAEDKQFQMVDLADSQNGNVPLGQTKTALINESGLFSLILSSKLASAKLFKRWVTSEVLPSIRKHGAYMTDNIIDALQDNPDAVPEYLNRLRDENARAAELRRQLERKTAQLALAKPKAAYYDAFVDPADCTNIRTTAKELGIPEKKFTKFLVEQQYMFRDKKRKLFPRANKKCRELFIVRDFYTEYGNLMHYTLITPAGKQHFMERMDEIMCE